MPSSIILPPGAALSEDPLLGTVLELTQRQGRSRIALHGATVLSFQPEGAAHDLLWLSGKARAAGGKAIRGGIPLCGPWFGPHGFLASAPTHGLLRATPWSLLRVVQDIPDELSAEFVLSLPADPALGWRHQAEASFRVTVGKTLKLELSFRNTGHEPFLLSGALHSYFAVSDVRKVRVEGLAEREYLDYTGGAVRRWHGSGPLALQEEAAKMFYSGTPVQLVDKTWGRTIHVRGWGSASTVVWNPWDKTAATMADVGDEWRSFLCVENANIPDVALPLNPNTSHHLGTEISMMSH